MSRAHASPGSVAYARALAEAVEAEGGAAALQDAGDVVTAVCEAWEADRTLRSFFLSTEVEKDRRRAAMGHLVEGRFPRLVGNFLRLLLRRGRLDLLPEIGEALHAIVDERLGRVPVTLTTAVPVPEAGFRAWRETIRRAVGEQAVVEHVVRPEIIAGAVVRVGDRVLDGSARRQLSELQHHIVERGMQRHALPS